MDWQDDLHLYSQGPGGPPSQPLEDVLVTQGPCTSLEVGNTFVDPMRHRASISSSSGSSVYEPDSPTCQRRPSTFSDATEDDAEDAPWNLVAYHVPWGPGYEGYEAGTLPGPDGTSVFLRSPTPLKRQRTSQACDRCRERKAKCSGNRPSCSRCTDKGLSCNYSASPLIPDAALPTRSLTRRLSVANSKEHLRLSARNRMRRKSSPGEADPVIEDMNRKPKPELRAKSQPSLFDLSGPSVVHLWRDEPSQQSVVAESSVQVGNGFNASVIEPYGCHLDQGNFTYELQARSFPSADQVPSGLYAQPISALDSYRFPPASAEDMSELAIPSTGQLQSSPPKLFNENSVLPQLWNDANGVFQDSGPRSDIGFSGHPPSNYQESIFEFMAGQPPEYFYQPPFEMHDTN